MGCGAARRADRCRAAEALRRRDHRRWLCGSGGGVDARPRGQVGCRTRIRSAGLWCIEPIGRHDRSWSPPVVHEAHRAARCGKGEGPRPRGHGIASIPQGFDHQREDRRPAAIVRTGARCLDAGRPTQRWRATPRRCAAICKCPSMSSPRPKFATKWRPTSIRADCCFERTARCNPRYSSRVFLGGRARLEQWWLATRR